MAKRLFDTLSKKGQSMDHPFKMGLHYGNVLIKQGWLEATALNSIQQHREDALSFARSQFPREPEKSR